MTVATFTTYDQIGKAEDVSDVISLISPTATPFQTMIGSGSVDNVLYQWQEDSLASPAANAQVEGFTSPAAAMTPTVMRSNTTQIFAKTVTVTGSTKAMKTYGRAQELAYQLGKAGKEIKRDLEYALVGIVQAQVLGSTGVARKFDNAFSQIAAGVTSSNGAVDRALSETIVLDAMQLLYNNNGEASVLMVRPADARVVADFAYRVSGSVPVRSRSLEADEKKIVNAVDVYVTPWGDTLRVTINRWLKNTQGGTHGEVLLFDPDSWSLMTYRAWNRKPLPANGDFEAQLLLGEFGLKHKNQLLSARITDLT